MRQKWNWKHILLPERTQTSTEKLFKFSYFKVNVMEWICTLNLHFNVRLKPNITNSLYFEETNLYILGEIRLLSKIGVSFFVLLPKWFFVHLFWVKIFLFYYEKNCSSNFGAGFGSTQQLRRSFSTIYLDSYYLNMYTAVDNYGDKNVLWVFVRSLYSLFTKFTMIWQILKRQKSIW